MFRFYNVANKRVPKGYYSVNLDPSYRTYDSYSYCTALIYKKENPAFNEIIDCLKKCFRKADYIGCYSFIYWRYYKEFYEWIVQNVNHKNASNKKVIKRFYKKALLRWIAFIQYSDDTLYPQNEYFRKMKNAIEAYGHIYHIRKRRKR